MLVTTYIKTDLIPKLLNIGCPIEQVITQNDYRKIWYSKPYESEDWEYCDAYYIPSHAQIMKWFRDEKQICIDPYAARGFYRVSIIDMNDTSNELYKHDKAFTSYELAADAAIEYVVDNLIKHENKL